VVFIPKIASAQMFTDISNTAGNPGSGYVTTLRFADVDNDGDQDIFVSTDNAAYINYNDNMIFSRYTYLEGVATWRYSPSVMDVGDYDRDGHVDFVTGSGYFTKPPSFHLILNKDPQFPEAEIDRNYIRDSGGATFGDFDNDGDLDILSGDPNFIINSNDSLTRSYYRVQTSNVRGIFWTDFDKDNKLDVFTIAGSNNTYSGYIEKKDSLNHILKRTPIAGITKDIEGVFFADIDSDGDMDMLADYGGIWTILSNNNGAFTAGATFPAGSTARIADMNNDGRPDVVIAGVMEPWQVFQIRIYTNNGNGTFTKVDNTGFGTSNESNPDIDIADFDNDGDLDIAEVNPGKLYRNNTVTPNAPPGIPVNLSESTKPGYAIFHWTAPTDDKTASNGLSYNVDLRKTDGSIVTPSHSLLNGKRLIPKMGNAYNNTTYRIGCLQDGDYTWKVQAIDAGFMGSEFSTGRNFSVSGMKPTAPANLVAVGLSDKQVQLTWTDLSSNETAYVIQKKNEYLNRYLDYDTVAANVTSYIDSVYLTPQTSYKYRVIAFNCAYPTGYSADVAGSTFPPLFVESNWLPANKAATKVELGDIDNDGDLDAFVNNNGVSTSVLFTFKDGKFQDSGIAVPQVNTAEGAQWVDLNNDGYLDLFTNVSQFFDKKIAVYINDHGTRFIEKSITTDVPFFISGRDTPAFADFDGDGDLDMLAAGTGGGTDTKLRLRLFENRGSLNFRQKAFDQPGVIVSRNAWGDYDKDGDPDILAFTTGLCTTIKTVIIENNGNGTFTSKPTSFGGLLGDLGSGVNKAIWTDFNSDGYPDIFFGGVTGCTTGDVSTTLLINNKNKTFTASNAANAVQSVHYDLDFKFGDLNLDGSPDLVVYGDSWTSSKTQVYLNRHNTLFNTGIDYLTSSIQYGNLQIGDIDSDDDLDLVIAGEWDYVTPAVTTQRNNMIDTWRGVNAAPSIPTNLNATLDGYKLTFSWTASTDDSTPQSAITYEMYLITEGDTIVATNSNGNGTRKLVKSGNADSRLTQTILVNKFGNIEWGVQAIDASFKSSKFATQQKTITGVPRTDDDTDPDPGSVTGIGDNQQQFTVFPNPAKGHIYVEWAGDEPQVYDIIGNQLQLPVTKIGKTYDFNSSNLSSGVYIIRVKSGFRKVVVTTTY
jgi:hypothetical protein